MRKTTICLSILLAVAVSTAAQAKKHHHRMAAPEASMAGKPNGYAWPGMPYTQATQEQRSAFWSAALNPMSAK